MTGRTKEIAKSAAWIGAAAVTDVAIVLIPQNKA
jgi:hypothetical protein